ncbi:MAG TPA: DUF4215 domain-containing protein [Nannocystis sp.]|jgi:cysteine-rich repeat protein
MHRILFVLSFLLLAACGVEELEAILAKYDTYGSTGSTGGADTSSDTSSSTGPDTTDSPGSTTTEDPGTAGADAGMDTSSTTTPSDTGESTTTGPAEPFCGDGFVDPGESCDDMNDNPDDGCKLCTKDRFVFASSEEYWGYDLDGLYGADQRCRSLAAIALLPNFATYRAWLSDSTTAAADRITHSKGRYTLVNGLVVAADWDALISGTLENPINVTESSGVSVGSAVWTGTLPNGQPAFGNSFCNGWSEWNGGDEEWAGEGLRNQTDAWWSYFEQAPCGSDMAIYCFEN